MENRREGGSTQASPTSSLSVCEMVQPSQESNDPVPQLGPLQPQKEFI